MDKILNYQASLFGNFEEIKADSETSKKMLSVFTDFIAGFALMTTVDFRTGQLINTKRLQLKSNKNNISITFMPERIDIDYHFEPFINNEELKIEKVYKLISETLMKMKDMFSELKGNRLATSCNILSDVLPTELINSTINKFSNKNILFGESDDISEWLLRFNSIVELDLMTNREKTNRICALSLSKKTDFINQFQIVLDINTIPENKNNRFGFSDLVDFSEKGKELIYKYIEKFENAAK